MFVNFLYRLGDLAQTCEFDDKMDEMICDKIVSGNIDQSVRGWNAVHLKGIIVL